MERTTPITSGSRPNQQNLLEQILYYWNAMLRWKWTGLTVAILIVALTLVYVFISPHIYSAKGTIWIDETQSVLPFEELSRLSGGINSQSHALLLKSRSLASDVIEKMRLHEHPEFMGPKLPVKLAKEQIQRDNPVFKERLIDQFIASLNVSPITGTKLIQVSFDHKNPRLAAEVLNTLLDSYIEMLIKRKYTASEQATEFLSTQISALRKDIEEAEKKLAELGTAQGILPLSSAEAPLISKITEVNTALTAATLDRVNKYTTYNQLKALRPEELPESPSNPAIARLREQYALLSREYARRLATLKPEYPEMQKLKSEIEATYESLANEKENLIKTAYADYQGALAKEQNLQRLLDDLKAQAYKANSTAILYNSLKIETDNKKSLLEALSKRQSETDLASRLKDLQALNVWIVDKASVPVNPSFPNRRKTFLIGVLLALVGGAGTSLFINYLVATVKSSRDITQATGWATIGTIPAFEKEYKPKGPRAEFRTLSSLLKGKPGILDKKKKKKQPGQPKPKTLSLKVDQASQAPADTPDRNNHQIELIIQREPRCIQSEAFRSIRTSLLLSFDSPARKALIFSSPLSKDGKSSVISNLGLALAQAHKRVVIVDSDLRKPRQQEIFNVDYTWGLTHFLSSIVDASEIIRPTAYTNLFVVPSGVTPSDPLEIMFSDKMKAFISFLKQQFDFVLFDSPPILAVSDALVLGKQVDGLILVVRAGQTPLNALKQARNKVEDHKINCLGVIINGVSLLEQEGYYARQYYHYSKPL
ncbi:MAG: polysaccharide biosynthesis tyrosine autokinase [Candidatus Aminicenantes bacterium]|nr:polysaccharide biosynthesis tyrosine autokinase [Candidatus Aminicenantes bacterium]